MQFDKITAPADGEKIEYVDGKISVPNNPIIPFIEGDGVGPDVPAAVSVHGHRMLLHDLTLRTQ